MVEYVCIICIDLSHVAEFSQRSVFGDKAGIPVFDVSDDDNEEEDDLISMRKQFASREARLKVRYFLKMIFY